ncbi:MAG: tetratricopeptide repeat protein, partial [Bacteroidetes bacterium]
GNMEAAVAEFGKYLEKFPHGYFVLNANFYRSEAAVQLKQYDLAIRGYDRVLDFKKNVFTERSLLAASEIYLYQQKFNDALLRFTMLEEVAESAENLLEARIGLMRCNYQLNNFDAAHTYAQKLLRSDNVGDEVVGEAMLTSAKCALAQNDLRMAQERFKETLLESNNEVGAEAMYNLANIHFLQGEFDRSQELIFEMVNIFPNYGKWISKSFLLLADNYASQGDLFQAKLTLQNVIDNYEGELKDEAQQKLDELNAATPALEQRKDGAEWNIEFEQEGRVRDEIFEADSVDADKDYEIDFEEK